MKKKFENTKKILEDIHEEVIQQNDDMVVLVIGDSGMGKSTFMLSATLYWQKITGRSRNNQDVLDRLVFGERDDYLEKLNQSEEGDIITVQDAPHILFSKDAMVSEQKDIEKAMFDIRSQNYLIMLGFHSWEVVPKDLRDRRAKITFRLRKDEDTGEKGYVDILGRREMHEKVDNYDRFSWPEPRLQDRFDSLEGTSLWEEFVERDDVEKRKRRENSKNISEKDARKQEHIKFAIRMAQPWDDTKGEKYREIAKYIDYEIGWISERVTEWKEGEYRDLVEQTDTTHRVTERVEG